jgi:hypothetical protein
VWDQVALYHSKDILTIHRDCERIISYYIKQPVPLSLPEITRISPESLQKPRSSKKMSVYNWTYINFPILQEECIALKFFIKQGNCSNCRQKHVVLSYWIKYIGFHVMWVHCHHKMAYSRTADGVDCLQIWRVWMSQAVTDSWQGEVLQCGV